MSNHNFSDRDFWKAIVLYGLNAATYKIAFAKTLLILAEQNRSSVTWSKLSEEYFKQFKKRLKNSEMPQLSNPKRLTVMERILKRVDRGLITETQAIEEVGKDAFNDVIKRFHSIGRDKDFAKDKFYEFNHGNNLIIKDSVFLIAQNMPNELFDEINARWSLLESAFLMKRDSFSLENDIREIYLDQRAKRTNITKNIPFLSGYQGNTCFYCCEPINDDNIHVDHVLPFQVLQHDEIWNLVLSHSLCNESKSDNVVGPSYIEKLIARNENIMGSNHPWKNKIKEQLGDNPDARKIELEQHYDNVKSVLGRNYWRGSEYYSAANDPFYRSLITKLNNK